MPETVIETKLLLPRPRQRTVSRPRLLELLERGAEATLTLLAAPAGFGKTTLLGAWVERRRGRFATAWVSLDDRDTDPAVFWTHVLHAIERAAPGSATPALAALASGQTEIDQVLTLLVNELGVTAEDLGVVLDDYHLAETQAVAPGMSFLVEHLPPHVHLVISTRADPALPLSRLRARGELVEIRAAALRFDSDEAATYLNDVNALELGDAELATLESRTEGWAAALQLAALSLQGKENRAEFIAGFAGDDRFVVDYLGDEVLDRQPPDVRSFLLETAVLDELTASLCDAVTERADSREMLGRLERQNLFLVPLDERREKYRYHHLFADVLRAHLLADRPTDMPVLHRRASDWYHRAGEPEAAVRHAVAAGDLALAAERVELAIPSLMRDRREALVRRWATGLPADVVRDRPVLAVGLIGGLMSSNDFTDVARRLEYAENLMDRPREDLVIVDETEFLRLPALLQTYRAALALVDGDTELTEQHSRQALRHAAQDDHRSIAAASALLGLACWRRGDLDAAHRAYRSAADHLEQAGHIADVLGCSITLADLEITRGQLREAQHTFEHALALTGGSRMRGVADMHVGLSRVAWEQGDLAAAAEHLRRADEAGEDLGLPQNPYRWRVMLARLRHADGDSATAVELLEEAERVYVADFSPDVQPVAATRAGILAASGDLPAAREWARAHGVAPNDAPTYLHEYAHLVLARILLAEHAATADRGVLRDAAALLDGIGAAAEAGGRIRTVIEARVLHSLAGYAAGDVDAALRALATALRLAEPEGFVGVFTEGGPGISILLHELSRREPADPFVRRILSVLDLRRDAPQGAATSSAAAARGDHAGALVEPLSSREVDVLRLLGSDLSGPDIARQLHVSLATVRTHTQHIYAKLGVNNRRAAVRRAHQLGLFPRPGR